MPSYIPAGSQVAWTTDSTHYAFLVSQESGLETYHRKLILNEQFPRMIHGNEAVDGVSVPLLYNLTMRFRVLPSKY